MYKRILVPTDGSELSDRAVKQAVDLAKTLTASIAFLNVTGEYPHVAFEEAAARIPASVKTTYYEEATLLSKKLLENAKKVASTAGVECSGISVHAEAPYVAIIAEAKKAQCDLIVMASHGRRGISGLLLGSETVKVLTHSTIPVLVIR